jgi:hypothetical protein
MNCGGGHIPTYAWGSGKRPSCFASGAGVAHFPQPAPHPDADLPNHVLHAARTTYAAATATRTPTIAS